MPNLPYISPELLGQYQKEVSSKSSPATAKRRMSALKRFFGWAEKEGHIPENPIPQTPPLIEPGTQIIPVKKPWFKPVNILKVGIPVVLVVLLFLLARQVRLPIPFLPAPALEPNELTGVTPASPTPQPLAGPTPQATASEEIDPIFSKIYKDGVLTLEGLSSALKAIGGLLIEGEKIIIKTTDTSDGDIEINPDGSGIAHFLFEGTGQNFLNAQAPNLTSGSLYYGIVANNAVGYDLLRLQSGSKPITRFSIDALGNTEVGGNLDLAGNLSTLNVIRLTSGGALTNITGYSQVSGNFTISQGEGDTATITKKASALNDVLTLTLDERGAANSIYSTLTLKRYDGAVEAMALFVDEGNARFDNQVQLGRFSSNPTSIGQGSLIFNTSDTSLYIWNGSSWVNLGGGSVSGFWQRISGVLSPLTTTDDLAIGGADSTAPFFVSDSGNVLIDGNTTLGDTSGDIVTVNATSSFNAQVNISSTNKLDFNSAEGSIQAQGSNVLRVQGSGQVWIAVSDRNPFQVQYTDALFDQQTSVAVGKSSVATSKFEVTDKKTGKALVIFDENGDQAIWTASASGVPKATLLRDGTLQFHQASSITTTTDNLTLQPAGSSTTANVQIGAGGVGSTTPDLLVLDAKSTTGNPTGTNGAMYYNVFDLKFRCYENGAWTDCIGASGSSSWSALTAPTANLSLAHSDFTTAFSWDTASDVNRDYFTMSITNDLVTDTSTQRLLILSQSNDAIATGTTEALLSLENNDANEAVTNGILFSAGGAATPDFTYGLNFDAADFTTEIVLENGETIDNQTDNQINLGLGTTGTLLLTSATSATFQNSAGNLNIQIAGTGTTANLQVGAGGAGSTTPDLLVLDIKTLTGDPTGTNGAVYYNAGDSKFRCFEASAWMNCIGAASGSTPWSSLTDPSTNLTLNMVANTTTMNWDFAVDGTFWDMNFDNNGGTAGTDYAVEIANVVSTNSAGDLNTEALLRLDNADTSASGPGSTIVDNAILVTNSGGITSGVVDALDASATEIDNALNAGQNFILLSALRLFEPSSGTLTVEDTSGNDMIQIIDQGTKGRLAVSDSLQVSGLTTVAYSRIGTDAADHFGTPLAEDLLVSGRLEVRGIIYLDSADGTPGAGADAGKAFTIANYLGTGVILFSNTPAEAEYTLSAASWLVENTGNVGKAALMVNQTDVTVSTTDIFAASSSGTTRFRINRDGGTFITGTAGTLFTVGGGAGKIDVGTVDPVYNIGGVRYATYMAGMVGVKEETTGKVTTSEYIPGLGYKTTIDFKTVPEGSDLWLFSRAADLKNNIGKLIVLLSPSDNTRVWYDINKNLYTLSIYSSLPTEISYRLTAPRFDYSLWTNYNDNPHATGFEVENEPLTVNGEGEIEEAKAENLADLTLEEAPSPTGSIFENLNLPVYQIKDVVGNIIQEVAKVSDFVAANIKVGALEAEVIAAKSLISFQATIDNLLVTNGLVSPVIETATISPLPDEPNLTVKIGQENIDSGFGKLIVANTQGEEVASIDTQGNASFSGTLEANEVKTNEITAGKIYADEIIAGKGGGMTREEIEEMLREVEEDQTILTQASSWSIDTSEGSANLEELVLGSLYVTETAALNTLSVTSSITLGSDLVIQSRQSENLTLNSIDTLSAPLSIQSLALAPVEIMAGKVRIDTDGRVSISGNLNVAGQIESAALKTKELTIDKLIIAADKPITENPQLTTGEITTNATAGTATIPAGIREITINNPNISDYTLVYVTPTSSTLNNVLYLKSKGSGFFTVGFSEPLAIEVTFNWWVIDIKE